MSFKVQNTCLNEGTWKSKCLEAFCIVHLRRYTHSEPKWGPQETVKLYTKICKKKVKGKVVGKVPCFACYYSPWRECLQGDSCCWDCNYHVVMNKEWTSWVSRKHQTSYDKEQQQHMMMMVTTSCARRWARISPPHKASCARRWAWISPPHEASCARRWAWISPPHRGKHQTEQIPYCTCRDTRKK